MMRYAFVQVKVYNKEKKVKQTGPKKEGKQSVIMKFRGGEIINNCSPVTQPCGYLKQNISAFQLLQFSLCCLLHFYNFFAACI